VVKLMTRRRRWGRWRLDLRPPASLRFWVTPGYPYDIRLDTCRTRWERQMWLLHMSHKRWLTARDQIDLALAFHDLFGEKDLADGQTVAATNVR